MISTKLKSGKTATVTAKQNMDKNQRGPLDSFFTIVPIVKHQKSAVNDAKKQEFEKWKDLEIEHKRHYFYLVNNSDDIHLRIFLKAFDLATHHHLLQILRITIVPKDIISSVERMRPLWITTFDNHLGSEMTDLRRSDYNVDCSRVTHFPQCCFV